MVTWNVIVYVVRSKIVRGLSLSVYMIISEESALKEISDVAPGLTGAVGV